MFNSSSRFRKVVLLLIVLLSTPVATLLLRPEFVLNPLLKSSAAEWGLEILSMEISHLGLKSTTLAQLSIQEGEQRYDILELSVSYSLSKLLAGRVESVDVSEVQVHLGSTTEQRAGQEAVTVSGMLETLDELPTDSLSVDHINLVALGTAYDGYQVEMSLQSPPLRIEGSARLNDVDDLRLGFEVHRTGAYSLDLESRAFLNDELTFEAVARLEANDDRDAFAVTGTLHTGPAREQIAQFLPATTFLLNDALSIAGAFEVQQMFGDTPIVQVDGMLNSPDAQIRLSQESDFGNTAMQLRLPVSIDAEIAIVSGELQLELSEIYGSGGWNLENFASQSEHSFGATALRCTSFANCELQSEWRSTVSSWRYDEYIGQNLTATAPLRLNYSNNEMRLSAETLDILIPSVRTTAPSAFSELATNLELDELEIRVGDVVSGGFNFRSRDFRIDNDIVELNNPAYSGKLQLEDDVLTGILEFDLDENLRLGIGLQHFFLRDTGDVVLQLAAQDFSETESLSKLITPLQLDADILAGRIEGLANISWSKQLDNSWRFGGPIALKVDGLSGFYADYFFVDLNTDLFAEATTPLGMQVSNPASASLGIIDIGVPLENISWQYRFDSLASEVQLIDFQTDLLGGKLSIPAALYNPDRNRQQIDVVLADIRVDSLVNLADYPGLRADGLLSGYLPLVIEGDSLVIERGLVGALKPGGSIRYTPANTSPNSNQSLRLVNDALSNYIYQTMNTEVTYGTDGELLLKVQLHGSNPDMNNGQAINLNVNISDNIPSLLRSLQASRVITDELERYIGPR